MAATWKGSIRFQTPRLGTSGKSAVRALVSDFGDDWMVEGWGEVLQALTMYAVMDGHAGISCSNFAIALANQR